MKINWDNINKVLSKGTAMTAIIYRFLLGLKNLNIHVNQFVMILCYSNFDNKNIFSPVYLFLSKSN